MDDQASRFGISTLVLVDEPATTVTELLEVTVAEVAIGTDGAATIAAVSVATVGAISGLIVCGGNGV